MTTHIITTINFPFESEMKALAESIGSGVKSFSGRMKTLAVMYRTLVSVANRAPTIVGQINAVDGVVTKHPDDTKWIAPLSMGEKYGVYSLCAALGTLNADQFEEFFNTYNDDDASSLRRTPIIVGQSSSAAVSSSSPSSASSVSSASATPTQPLVVVVQAAVSSPMSAPAPAPVVVAAPVPTPAQVAVVSPPSAPLPSTIKSGSASCVAKPLTANAPPPPRSATVSALPLSSAPIAPTPAAKNRTTLMTAKSVSFASAPANTANATPLAQPRPTVAAALATPVVASNVATKRLGDASGGSNKTSPLAQLVDQACSLEKRRRQHHIVLGDDVEEDTETSDEEEESTDDDDDDVEDDSEKSEEQHNKKRKSGGSSKHSKKSQQQPTKKSKSSSGGGSGGNSNSTPVAQQASKKAKKSKKAAKNECSTHYDYTVTPGAVITCPLCAEQSANMAAHRAHAEHAHKNSKGLVFCCKRDNCAFIGRTVGLRDTHGMNLHDEIGQTAACPYECTDAKFRHRRRTFCNLPGFSGHMRLKHEWKKARSHQEAARQQQRSAADGTWYTRFVTTLGKNLQVD